MLAELGEDFTEETFRDTFGRTNNDILRDLFGTKYSPAQVQAAADRKELLYRNIIKQDFPAIDGAAELIDTLAVAGFVLAVGSSGPPENVALTLECLNCTNRISACVTGADVTRGKPDPQVFLFTAEKLNLPSHRCVVVEDAPAGVTAAKAAQMACIALTGTATREQLAEADLIVDSLRELSPERFSALIA